MSQDKIFVINMAKKKKEDFFNYVVNILQNSMLTGVPQIATAGNWPRRIIRTLVFFMCMAGFIYQSLSFMNIYWEYDVIMDIKVENPNYVERPSFTVCNKIGFKVQDFCKDKEEPENKQIIQEHETWCFSLEKLQLGYRNFCECLPRFCDGYGKLKVNYTMELAGLPELPRNQLKKWLLAPKEILEFCHDFKIKENRESKCSDHYYLQPGCQLQMGLPESCVTVNSLIGRPNHTLEKVYTDGEIRLVVNQHGENYPEHLVDPLSAISIHNPYTIINPLKNGYMMEVANNYHFRLKKVIKNLLPPPYKTNCKDYMSLWYARGGNGPTNLKECIQECQKNLSMEKHGCIIEDIYMPNNEKRCPVYLYDPTLNAEARKCSESCRPACHEEYYTVEVNSWRSRLSECKQTDNSGEFSQVYIMFDGMETTTYTYSPKFQNIETFSYLGGYVGIWLGISLVAVFDFLETIVVVFKYPLRRWARFKERRRKIHDMRQLERKH